MSRKNLVWWVLTALMVIGAVVLVERVVYYANLPGRLPQQEIVVVGQNRFIPGTQAALRLQVRDTVKGNPIPDAEVSLALRPRGGGKALTLFNGRSDASGVVEATFNVPLVDSPEQTLLITSRSPQGRDQLEQSVTVEREYRILLSTDKPLYQPGQVIYLRALVLDAFDLRPAVAREMTLTIADGKGNKVFRKTLTTSSYGAAWTEFQLANEVNTGEYKITAQMGNTISEKTVRVERYVLPKFKVEMQTERAYYQPGQRVSGTLTARYFFGKPVSGGEVRLEGYTFDVQRNTVFTLEGVTDDQGQYAFEFDLPAYLTGSEFEGGMARFYLQVTVTDGARHAETASLSLPVSASGLVVDMVPEGGFVRAGLENIFYLFTRYPDGTPAQATVQVTFTDSNTTFTVQTDAYGLGEVRVIPPQPYVYVTLQAQDTRGATAYREVGFEGEWSGESILLRPDKPVYRVGETMNLSVFSTQAQGTVYLDIVRGGQTISTRSVQIESGRAGVAVDLSADMYGTLEVHAYRIQPSGAITRDTRLVVVDPASDLNLAIQPGKDTYRPGEDAQLDVQVSGVDGAGVAAALGIAVVDESVFALAEQDPGFARLYFLLESEILTPRYDLHGYTLPDLAYSQRFEQVSPTLRQDVERAARASLAEAVRVGGKSAFTLVASSRQQNLNRAAQLQAAFFNRLSRVIFPVFLLAAAGVVFGVTCALAQEKRFWRSLFTAAGILLGLFLLIRVIPWGGAFWSPSPGESLMRFLEFLFSDLEMGLLLILLLGGVGILGMAGVAIRRRNWTLGGTILLTALTILSFLGSLIAVRFSNRIPSDAWLIAALIAFLLMIFSQWVRVAGFLWERAFVPALFGLALALSLTIGWVPLGVLLAGGAAMAPAPAAEDFAGPMRREALGAVPMLAPQATVVPSMVVEERAAGGESAQTAQQAPRLRQYFPETMLWIPDAVTDSSGFLRLNFPVADSITTWRITALASSADGRLGSVDAPLRVFQDFFIDLDLPLALTVGDEIAVPVGVYNYLPEPQTVRLVLEPAGWFDLLDEPEKSMTIGANEVSVAYFRIRARDFGYQPFKVTAYGSRLSDAILKSVQVYPDGKPIRLSASDRLEADKPIRQTFFFPPEAIAGTQKVLVKVYPGVFSQVVEGLDSLLRMPFGCFEQTSSITYPNVLALDYLRTSGQTAPEVELKAEEYINLGYQRLTTFEVAGGGFSLFGNPPADRMLTAYGLQEFADMARVHPVDDALVRRAAEWLMSQQSGDGSWENDRGLVHENTWQSLGNDRLPVTGYVVWSLIDAGFERETAVQKGLAYLRDHLGEAKDPYVLGLVANALVSADRAQGEGTGTATRAALDALAAQAQRSGGQVFWQSQVATFTGAEGQTGSIETTALVALAMLRAQEYPDLTSGALAYLIAQKDSFGTWHSTQATVLSLKALLEAMRTGGDRVDARVTITLNGGQVRTLQVTQDNFDVVQMVTFEDVPLGRENAVDIRVEGQGNLMAQVVGSYYLPWSAMSRYPDLFPVGEGLDLQVSYDRTELSVDDTVTVQVSATLQPAGARAEAVMLDLGIPPGFSVMTEDLDALVTRYSDVLPSETRLERYELTGRQVLVYLTGMKGGEPFTFSYRLRARFPLRAQAPSALAYDYYNPQQQGELPPQLLVVNP